jgi:RHS repeat-associated protein
LTDHLGSTSALADVSGNVVEQLAYDSFGNSSGSSRTRYGYTGRERDPETGMLYYRARFYDPQAGRFISEDPIGFRGGDNFYQYVGNSPISFADPLGLATCSGPPEPNLPQKMARCLALAKRMAGALKEIKRLEKNYDPVLDFEGGYPIRKTLRSGQVIDLGNSKQAGTIGA